jgi:threonine dehydrogenase-like Zn-dependent dehydrogenase
LQRSQKTDCCFETGEIEEMEKTMQAAFLPGNSTVEMRTVAVPVPAHGEVLIRVKASTICGSDIRCIYHEHLGKGPEGYQGVIAGHEPCGQIVEAGLGCRLFKAGDRVIVYHISGCGVCNDCRRGYMISCTSEKYRRAYGWQRDGGMAEYMIAEEKDLIALPDALTYADGAQVACGFGTVYEGLEKIGINGNHAVLITGLGPVGLAAAALCRKLGAQKIIGIDVVDERLKLAKELGLCDDTLVSGEENVAQIKALTGGFGVERAVECSANSAARATAIRATRKWGKMVMIGEGGGMQLNPSPDMIHDQKTLYGSWVTSTWLMEELVERLVRWNLHPADIITHRFALDKASDAYALMASGKCGKVAVCADEELTSPSR